MAGRCCTCHSFSTLHPSEIPKGVDLGYHQGPMNSWQKNVGLHLHRCGLRPLRRGARQRRYEIVKPALCIVHKQCMGSVWTCPKRQVVIRVRTAPTYSGGFAIKARGNRQMQGGKVIEMARNKLGTQHMTTAVLRKPLTTAIRLYLHCVASQVHTASVEPVVTACRSFRASRSQDSGTLRVHE